MNDEPKPKRTVVGAAPEPSEAEEDPWRTMAGLLGRAWLAHERDGTAGVPGPDTPLSISPVAAVSPARSGAVRTVGPESGGSSRGHVPLGGVASFVAEVAVAHHPAPAGPPPAVSRPIDPRHRRGIHCRLPVAPAHASHNPCQRPLTDR